MKLTSLLTEAIEIESYSCNNVGSDLTSLTERDIPTKVRQFKCVDHKLTDLKGSPAIVQSSFNVDNNHLTTLEGAPVEIGSYFSCEHNYLTDLKGAPQVIKGVLYCDNNKLTSLQDIHKHIKEIWEGNFIHNEITSHVLGLLKIKNLRLITLDNRDVQNIINKHLKGSTHDIFACQEELEDAGFEKFAKL